MAGKKVAHLRRLIKFTSKKYIGRLIGVFFTALVFLSLLRWLLKLDILFLHSVYSKIFSYLGIFFIGLFVGIFSFYDDNEYKIVILKFGDRYKFLLRGFPFITSSLLLMHRYIDLNRVFPYFHKTPLLDLLLSLLAAISVLVLPGFLILQFLRYRANSLIELASLSISLSVFIVPFLIPLEFNLAQFIPVDSTTFYLLILQLMSIIYLIYPKQSTNSLSLCIDKSTALVTSIIVAYALMSWSIDASNGVYPGDEAVHLGNSLYISSNKTFYEKFRNGSVGFIWWSEYILGLVMNVSGVDPLNSFLWLHAISILPLVSLYLLSSFVLSKPSGRGLVVALVSFFAGYGWLLLVSYPVTSALNYLKEIQATGQRTYDILMTTGNLLPFLVPTSTFALFEFFLAAYLLLRMRKATNKFLTAMFSISLATMYLSHLFETAVFSFVIFSICLLYPIDVLENGYRTILKKYEFIISVIVGILFAALVPLAVDIFFPWKNYTTSPSGEILRSFLYWISFGSCLVSCILGSVLHKVISIYVQSFKLLLLKLKHIIRFAMVMMSLLLLLSYISLLILFALKSQNLNPVSNIWRLQALPPEVIPIRFGVVGTLFVFSIFQMLLSKNISLRVKIILFYLVTLVVIMLGLFYLPPTVIPAALLPVFIQARLTPFVWILVSFVVSEILTTRAGVFSSIIPRIHLSFAKLFIKTLAVLFLVLIGTSSSILGIAYYSTLWPARQPSRDLLEDLRYVLSRSQASSSILVDPSLNYYLTTFFGIHKWHVLPIAGVYRIFLQVADPITTLYFISSHNIQFYVRDNRAPLPLNDSSYFIKLLQFSKIVLKRDDVVVYELPQVQARAPFIDKEPFSSASKVFPQPPYFTLASSIETKLAKATWNNIKYLPSYKNQLEIYVDGNRLQDVTLLDISIEGPGRIIIENCSILPLQGEWVKLELSRFSLVQILPEEGSVIHLNIRSKNGSSIIFNTTNTIVFRMSSSTTASQIETLMVRNLQLDYLSGGLVKRAWNKFPSGLNLPEVSDADLYIASFNDSIILYSVKNYILMLQF